jgi:hypothetical protein
LVELFCVSLSVFAALAVSHWIEHRTGLEHQEIRAHRTPHRTVRIQAGRQILTAAEPVPDYLAQALSKINTPTSAH